MAIKHSLKTRQLILSYIGLTKKHKRIGTPPCTLRQPWVSVGPWSFHKRFRIHKARIGWNSPVSPHCHLTRKRPLLGRDSLSREQREIPGLMFEWFEQEQGLRPAGQRQSRESAERGSGSCSY